MRCDKLAAGSSHYFERGWISTSGAACGQVPQFRDRLSHMKETTNRITDLIDDLQQSGGIFVICPDRDLDVSIFCGDMEKLDELYNLGRQDTKQCEPQLLTYLHRS